LLSITTGLSSILNTMAPLFGALIAWLVFKEQLTRWRTLGMVLGFLGAALLALEAPGGVSFKPGGSGLAIACCLLGGLSYGISGNYTQRYLQHIPPMVLATGSQMGASIALLLPALWLWPGHAPDLPTWGALFVSAALCTGLAYVLFFRLIAQLGSSGAMTVTYVAPVFASVIGMVVLDEKITGWMLGCAAIVLVGTALATGLLPLKKASVSAR
jgi:drug/metabolite transporter (DMT)-like permease